MSRRRANLSEKSCLLVRRELCADDLRPRRCFYLDDSPLCKTTYKAVKVAGTKPSDLVAVFGVGGLGHLAIQYAAIAGGRVVAVDLVDEKLQLAKELGAEFTVNAQGRIRRRTSGCSAAQTKQSRWR
jgi:Zinc-binding dehydrogenase